MRILHTADWHLGKIFYERHLTEDQRYVLQEQFLPILKEERIDAVIIAGDIYDRGVPPLEAVELFNEMVSKVVNELNIPLLMINGNHDSAQRLAFGKDLLARQGFYVETNMSRYLQPICLEDQYGPIYFSLLPYSDLPLLNAIWDLPRNAEFTDGYTRLAKSLQEKTPKGKRNIAVAHGFVAGGEASESERPLVLGGSEVMNSSVFEGYHYVALGHLHGPQKVGKEHIRYSGSLLPYSFDEHRQKKSFTIIDMDKCGNVEISLVPIRPQHDVRIIEGRFDDIMKHEILAPTDYVQINLLDTVPVMDSQAQLRKLYPYLLSVVFSNVVYTPSRDTAKNHRQLNERELFAQFIYSLRDENLTAQEKEFVDNIWSSMVEENK